MTTYYPQLLASRILLDADRTSLSAADDGSVTDHDRASKIILALQIGYNARDTAASAYKIQWRNVTDAGTFADVSYPGEVQWTEISGVLVDGTAVTSTTRRCSARGDQTWQNGLENVGDNRCPDSGTIDIGSDCYTELQWAIDLSSAGYSKQYEFRLWNITSGASVGTAVAKITTLDAPITLTVDNSYCGNVSDSPTTSYFESVDTSFSDTQDVHFYNEDTEWYPLNSLFSVLDGATVQVADSPVLSVIFTDLPLTVEDSYIVNAGGFVTIPDTVGPADTVWRDEDNVFYDEVDASEFYPHDESLGTLVSWSAYHSNVSDDVLLDLQVFVTAESAYHVNSADVPIPVYEITVTAENSYSANVSGDPAVFIDQYITGEDSYHAQYADSVSISTSGALELEDAYNANVADDLNLIQEQVLWVVDSYLANVADMLVMSQTGEDTVYPEYAYHVNAADSVELQQESALVVEDSYHANAGDSLDIVEEGQLTLTVSDAYSENLADDVIISESLEVSVDSSYVINLPDELLLYQEYVAENLDSYHPHVGDDAVLSVEQLLAIADAYNLQRAESPVLRYLALGLIVDPYVVSLTALRTLTSLTSHYEIREK